MNNDAFLRKLLILLVLKENQRIDGRKKLQKIIYLVNSLGWNAIQDYRFHLYGPYSDDLLSEVENLEEMGLINVTKTSSPFGNPFYLHSLTQKGQNFLESLIRQNDVPALIDKTRRLSTDLSNFSAELLEVMASLYFLSSELPQGDINLWIDNLRELKPNLNDEIVSQGEEIFNIMEYYN